MQSRKNVANGSPTLAGIVPSNVRLRGMPRQLKIHDLVSVGCLYDYIYFIVFHEVVNTDGASYELAG
jgi:hypothetical protein